MSKAAASPVPPPSPTSPAAAAPPQAAAGPIGKVVDKAEIREIILRKHYDLFYWWVVWAYAAFAALWTRAFGVNVRMTDYEPLKESLKRVPPDDTVVQTVRVFTEPWLAIGFIGIILFVAIFTAVRARGPMSMVLVLSIFAAALLVSWTITWEFVFKQFPLLRVYINQGVYVATAVILFPVWLLTTFLLNRLHYLRFRPNRQIADVRPFGGGEIAIASHTLALHKLPEDIFVHRILGLWWLGFGTADIEVAYTRPDGSAYREVFENVVHPTRKINAIQQMLR
jgi:hypothetical protein